MVARYKADQGICAGNNDATADTEQKHEDDDATEARRARQKKERDGDEDEAENEADLVALRVEQGADTDGCDGEANGLREGDGAVLRGREAKAVRELRQDGAEHGGSHAIDEDGQNRGEDEHWAPGPFECRRQGYGMELGLRESFKGGLGPWSGRRSSAGRPEPLTM